MIGAGAQVLLTRMRVLLAHVQLMPLLLVSLAQKHGSTALSVHVAVQLFPLLLPPCVALVMLLGPMGHAIVHICDGSVLLIAKQEQLEGTAGVVVLVHVVLTVALVQEQLKPPALSKHTQGSPVLLSAEHRLVQF